MKKKVLIVHNYYQIPGGEDTVVANEKKMLEENGHEVFLYIRDNKELKNMSKARKLLLPFTIIFNLKTYREVKKIIKEKKIDIVHVHNTLTLISPSVYYAALSCHVPVVQTVHNFRLLCPGSAFYRDGHICEDCVTKGLWCAIKHNCYRNSRLQTLACVINTKIHRMTGIYGKINYICLTEFNKEKLLNLKQVKPDRVFVKPNFVKEENEIIPFEKRKNQFVFAGRLDKLKGIDLLLEQWERMGEEAPLLIVCGTGPLEQWCKDFVKNHNCNVELKGFLPNKDVRELVARSKAMILPTRWYEGFPMSIVESYSVGTPVIVPNMGNCGSVVEDGVTGWKYDSIGEIVETVKKTMEKPLKYKEIHELYQKQYSNEVNYKMLEEIYDGLLK